MLKKTLLLFTLGITHETHSAQIAIRPLQAADLPQVMALDREISFSYFKPLFLQYPDRSLGKNADQLLEDALVNNEQEFTKALDSNATNHLLVAYSSEKLVGFVSFHHEDAQIMRLDLTFVARDYTQTGLDQQLASRVLQTPGVICFQCIVLKNNTEEAALCTSLGFSKKEMPAPLLKELPADCADLYDYYEYCVQQ